MDAGVQTNEDMGRLGAFQAACWTPKEEFSRVAVEGKAAHADSTEELAE